MTTLSDQRPKTTMISSAKITPLTPILAIRHMYRTILPRRPWVRRLLVAAVIVFTAITLGMYGIARWYVWNGRDKPLVVGTSFIADYATYLGVDPHATLTAILNDLHVRHLRLVSYWSDIEPVQGTYDFSELDWEFEQADAHGAKVSLAIGLRQPRWPECHMPDWAANEPVSAWQPRLERFMSAVINRYKHNPALDSYQLENEYYLSAFAVCPAQTTTRLIEEVSLVRKLDPDHTLIISRSQNAIGWPVREPLTDATAISIYRRVWQPSMNRYLEYPFPAWYYAFLAGMEKIWTGHDTVIHELQAEPWPPYNETILTSSLAVQNQSFDATRLTQTAAFGKATGMKTMDLWGSEYWYYRKTVLHDPSVWDTARDIFRPAKN